MSEDEIETCVLLLLLLFLPSVSIIPGDLKKITLRNAKKLEWPSVVILGKAVL